MAEAVVRADGLMRFGPLVLRVSLGRSGISTHKQEGDGATPAGHMALRRVLYRADRLARPRTLVPTEPLASEDGWCDDPQDPAYNRLVRLPYAGHHEEMWRSDPLYDVVGVLGWNDAPPVRGLGSAIFLHVRPADGGPTEGCVALALPDLLAVLAGGLTDLSVLA